METSKVQVEYRDPSGVFSCFEKTFNACLPLQNLHWNSSSRPLRSIDSLHVELRPETQSSGPTELRGRDDSTEAARTSASTDGVPKKERRHQIPGLRQTPYLRIFFLHCEDVEAYRSGARATLREWIAKHAATQADSGPGSRQENHDASEWLIVLVEGDGIEARTVLNKADAETVKKSTASRWKTKSSKSVIEKVRADFNGEKKNAIDRVAALSISKSDQQHARGEEADGDSAMVFSEVIRKMKFLILASFDRRVQQYEDDIKEKEQRRNMPGWNFNTFFVLKEGLARGFESVGLIEDALSNYQELATGLELLVTELLDDEEITQSTQFQDCTDDLQRILSRSLQEHKPNDSFLSRSRANTADLGLRLLDTDRKPFRSLILENNISVFDFECYIFARQVTLLLRQANVKLAIPGQSSAAGQSSSQDFSNGAHGPVIPGSENYLLLARICNLSLAFISNVTSRIRLDLQACRQQLLGGANKDVTQASDDLFEAVSNNIVASWMLSACQSILEITDTALLHSRVNMCVRQLRRSVQLQLPNDSPIEQSSPVDSFDFPRRTSSLLFRNPLRSPGESEDDETAEEKLNNDEVRVSAKPGLDDLAGARGDMLSLARTVLGELGRQCRGWLVGFHQIIATERQETHLADVDLTDGREDGLTIEPKSTSLHVSNGVVSRSIQSVFNDKLKFLAFYESMTVTGLAYYTIAARSKMIEAANADLAILYHEIKDFEVASTYYKQVTLHYSEKEWTSLSHVTLNKWAQCLKALGNIRESIVVSLRALQSRYTSWSLVPFATDSLSSLSETSKRLDQELASSLDHCFYDCILDAHIGHFDDHDGFYLDIHFETPFETAVEPGHLGIELRGLDDERSSKIWLSNEGAITTKSGRNTLRLSTKVTYLVPAKVYEIDSGADIVQIATFGQYVLQKIQFRLEKLIFVQERVETTDTLALPDARNSFENAISAEDRLQRLEIWPHAGNLSVQIVPAECIDLSKPRLLEVRILSGRNTITDGSIDIKPATPGLRLYSADAEHSRTDQSRALEISESTDIAFGTMQSQDTIIIKVPYTLETEHSEIRVRSTVKYMTLGGEFQFRLSHVIPHALSLAVNVQDNFKRDRLLSRFIIVSSVAAPVQILEHSITGKSIYKASILRSKSTQGSSFTMQPLDLVAEIRRRDGTPDENPPAQSSKRLSLHLAYRMFNHQILTEAESRLVKTLPRDLRDKYAYKLSTHLKSTLLDGLKSEELEQSGMHRCLHLRSYEQFGWERILQTFVPREAIVLKEFLEAFHQVNAIISLNDSENDFGVRRLVVPVDVPKLSVLHTVNLQVACHRGNNRASPGAILGEAILAELSIDNTSIWSHGEIPAGPRRFRYELRSNFGEWAVGGQASAVFEAQEKQKRSFTVVLLPQRVGHLTLPSINIETLVFAEGGTAESQATEAMKSEWISCEVDFLNQTEVVHVTAGAIMTQVSVDLALSNSRESMLDRSIKASQDVS